jgi:hypothetical protein
MVGSIGSFLKILQIYIYRPALGRNDLLHFPTCKKFAEEEDIAFVEYKEIIGQLSLEFSY